MSTHRERIKKIREHFNNISIEEFEKNLKEAGVDRIKPTGQEILGTMRGNPHYWDMMHEIDKYKNQRNKLLNELKKAKKLIKNAGAPVPLSIENTINKIEEN